MRAKRIALCDTLLAAIEDSDLPILCEDVNYAEAEGECVGQIFLS